ncbi:succinate-semialdehyde dehydrogenase [Tersicoccus phoenicis]|uniref:Succinate-semialdehyde dehydrogenase n=1 Tax=Tersicoccus phoenicis TaxID=554083 RepID=A0A1R1LPR1_9MICC|nr:NAD-dependent succinate-semialdehyde dehydrogenase [Tersicoccus phoenicis]OMH29538.1 succinate-semialdehyde dehydrogenase [Tersicoccus phoenicis]
MTAYTTVNPATGETLREFDELTADGAADVLDRSHRAFLSWRRTPLEVRTRVLARVAELYAERRQELSELTTLEMGKPVRQSGYEMDICKDIFAYYADNGPSFLADEELDVARGGRAVVRKEAIGPLIGIMPWNFPHYQVARFVAPNLMLGNTIILKHAPNCPQNALAMEQIFREAGLPADAYINVFATNDQIADMIADPRVQGVSLTGSERAGSAVAEVAGRNLKKVVLELGGSDPFIVLDAPDLDATVKQAAGARLVNGGQACNAAKRFIVLEDVYDDFVEKLSASLGAVTPGDPTNPKTFVGPLSSTNAVDTLMGQIDDAVAKGANVHTGGKRIDAAGAWVQPTVLTGVTPQMRAYTEELFGPAAIVYKVASADEAVELANASPYGLSGSVWSGDADKAAEVADRLDVGMAFVNEHGTTAADLPFGGVKRSGVGRELAQYGMDEFVNKKLVRITRR